MRVFAVVLALSLLLISAPSYAAPALQAAPAAQAAPATQKPAPPPAAPTTQNPAAPAAAPPPPAPKFQDGLKYAYLNVQVIAANSAEGKALNAKVQGLQEQKAKELNEKNRQLQASQDKLEKGGSVMSDQARQQLQVDIERQQRDIQRFTEDAQQDLQTLTQQLQVEFERKLTPVVDAVAKQKGLHFIFSAVESGLVWADPTMDLTGDVLQAFDAAMKTGK
jgi:Skp family chaperone for outer membrane proteins